MACAASRVLRSGDSVVVETGPRYVLTKDGVGVGAAEESCADRGRHNGDGGCDHDDNRDDPIIDCHDEQHHQH